VRLEIRHVRVLLAVVDEGSITRAARRLGIPQPSLSSQIRRIEMELGLVLFERASGGVTLTDKGHDLLQHLRAVDVGMCTIEKARTASRRSHLPPLAIGVDSSALFNALAEAPEPSMCPIKLMMAEPSALRASLLDGSLSLVLSSEFTAPAQTYPAAFRIATVSEGEVGTLIPFGHPLESMSELRPRHLADERWAAYPPGTTWHDTLTRFCRSMGFIPHVTYLTTSELGLSRILARRDSVSLGTPLTAVSVGTAWRSIGLGLTWRMIAAWNSSAIHSSLAAEIIQQIRCVSARAAASINADTHRLSGQAGRNTNNVT